MLTPKLTLDLTTGTLDPRVAFARADATATVVNSSGQIAMAAADAPRFDYNLNTGGACKGLLVEDQRTNLLTYSNPNAATPTGWSIGFNTGGTRELIDCTFVPFAFAHNAIRHIVSSGRSYQFKDFAVTPGVTYTVSFFIDVANSSVSGGPILNVTGGGTLSLFITQADVNGKITGSFTATSLSAQVRIGIGTTSAQTGTLIYTGWQMEAGAFATSYIPTEGSAVTRNADVAAITGTNFSDFWQASKGGAMVQATPSTVSGIRPLVQYDDGTADNIIALRGNAADPELQIVDGGAPQVQLDAGTIVANTQYSLTGWWQTNDCKARKDSGAVVTDDTATIPTVTQARLGSDGTNYLNGHLVTVNYYDSFFGQSIYTRRKNKVFASLL